MPSWSSTEPYSPAFFVRLYGTVLATGMGENIEAWVAPAFLVLLVTVGCIAALAARRKTPLEAGGLALLLLALLLPPVLVFAVTAFPGRQFHVPRLAPALFPAAGRDLLCPARLGAGGDEPPEAGAAWAAGWRWRVRASSRRSQ